MDNNSLLYFIIAIDILQTILLLITVGAIIDTKDDMNRIYKR